MGEAPYLSRDDWDLLLGLVLDEKARNEREWDALQDETGSRATRRRATLNYRNGTLESIEAKIRRRFDEGGPP